MLADTPPIIWPHQIVSEESFSSTTSAINIVFDSTTDRMTYIGEARKTDSLTTVYLRTGTVTVGCVIEVRIETVDATGRPTGTLWGTNTNGTFTIADTDDAVWKTCTLTAAASLTVGDRYAILVKYSSGSTPNLNFLQGSSTIFADNPGFPYKLLDAGAGSWAEISGSPLLMFIRYAAAGVIWHPSLSSMDGNLTQRTFTQSSAVNERGVKFSVPFKCRVYALKMFVANPAANASYSLSLWPASSTTDADALAQVSCSTSVSVNSSNDSYRVHFINPVTLTPGNTYYLGLRADVDGVNVVTYEATTPAISGAMGAMPGGANFHCSNRGWTAGTAAAWADDTSATLFAHLLIDQLDDGIIEPGGVFSQGLQVL